MFFQWMYKLHVCRYITSVYPSLRYSLCFFGLFFLFTIGLQYISHLKQKIVENNVKLLCVICMYVKCLSSDANHSKI